MALNQVVIMGRITHDLEIKQTQSGTAVLSFTVAVERSFVRQGEERQADFITCVAWRNQAEFINRYFAKGRMIAIVGNLRTRTYDDKNGTKHYVTEVYVDEAQFTGEMKEHANNANNGVYSGGNHQEHSNYTINGNTPQNGAQSVQSGDWNEEFTDLFNDDGIPF